MARWTYDPDIPVRYGDDQTYRLGMDALKGCAVVEDWGCGAAHAKQFCHGEYVGIDSAPGFCDIVAELRAYRSVVDGIFMRHVLEHNYDWTTILDNALASYTKRFVLILFTPEVANTEVHALSHDDIPDIAFNAQDITSRWGSRKFTRHTLMSETQYGREVIYVVEPAERGSGSFDPQCLPIPPR